jgi:hypothetical protein
MGETCHKVTRPDPTQYSRPQGPFKPRAKGSRLPCTEGVRVGVMPNAFTFLSTGTGEPDNAKVFCPVRRGTGRKGSNDLARGLPYLVPRSRFRQQLKAGVDMICIATDCAKRTYITTFCQLLAQSLSKSSDFMICVPFANHKV